MLYLILLRQIAIMALLLAIGVILCRTGFLSDQGAKDLGAILLKVIIPCVIVNSYITEFTPQRLVDLGLSAALGLLALAISMVIAHIAYGKKRPIENFSAAFSNVGFIGIPLTQAVIGPGGVFYVAAIIALLNLFQQTYGVYVITGRKDAISGKTIAKNPVLISIIIGIVLFLSRIPVPGIVTSTLGYVAGMNTPVAMILLGSYMAKLPLRDYLNPKAYSCVLLRLVVIPLVTLGIFYLIPVSNPEVTMAIFLAAATPVGSNVCVFAKQYDRDYELSVVIVCLTTVVSIVTVPLLGNLAGMLLT